MVIDEANLKVSEGATLSLMCGGHCVDTVYSGTSLILDTLGQKKVS